MSTNAVLRSRPWLVVVLCAATLLGCSRPSVDQQIAAASSSLQKNEPGAAMVQLKAVLQDHPQNAQARFLLGKALLANGDVIASIVEFDKAAELQHPGSEVLPILAKVLLGTGQAKKVTDRFESTELPDPAANAELKAIVGAAFSARGMRERSAANVNAALQIDPKNTLARLFQARQAAARGQMDVSLRLIDALLTDSPQQAQAWHLKGEVLAIGKGDIAGGEAAFNKALEINPASLPSYTALIALALQRKDIAAFDILYERLKTALPNHPETRFYAGQRALMRGDVKSAREGAQQILRLAPNNARALQLAGAAELGGGSTVLAVTHLTKALQIDPRLPAARHLLARAHLRSGEPARALVALQPLLDGPMPMAETLALAAEAHLQNGQFERSEAMFVRALKIAPDDAKMKIALAMAQIATGRTEAGFAQLESLAESDSSTHADYALISARLRRNELDSAMLAVDRLTRKQPRGAAAHHLRGQILGRRKDLVGARASFEQALAADGNYFPAVASLAELDIAENKLDAAVKRFEARIKREPRDYRALLALVQLKQRTDSGADQVKNLLSDAIRANPSEVSPRLMLVDYLLSRREFAAAKSAAQDGLASVPNNATLLDALGRSQLAAGETQQAVISLAKVVAAQPASALAHLRLAEAQMQDKDATAAARSLQRALAIDPKSIAAQERLMKVALAEKRVPGALEIARTVQKQRPTEPVGFALEGELHASQRQWPLAAAAFQAALDRGKSPAVAMRVHRSLALSGKRAEAELFANGWMKSNPRDAAFLLHLGTTALEAKDFAGAESRYRAALAIQPDNPALLNDLAWVLLRQGKPGAYSLAERANELAPDQPPLLDTLATALAADKQFARAIELQRRVIDLVPQTPTYRMTLARILLQSGDKKAAQAELEKLAWLGDKFAGQAEVAALLQQSK